MKTRELRTRRFDFRAQLIHASMSDLLIKIYYNRNKEFIGN